MTLEHRMRPTQRRLHAAALRLFADAGPAQLSISELAAAAGVARGTVYNLGADVSSLFDEVVEQLVEEMGERLDSMLEESEDWALRLAFGIRLYVWRAHVEPDWARFIVRFAYSSAPMQGMWEGGPGDNLRRGIRAGRYHLRRGQVRAALGMIVGAVLSAMSAVLEGDLTWRAAGSDTAEMLLVALGIERVEARALALVPLPALQLAH